MSWHEQEPCTHLDVEYNASIERNEGLVRDIIATSLKINVVCQMIMSKSLSWTRQMLRKNCAKTSWKHTVDMCDSFLRVMIPVRFHSTSNPDAMSYGSVWCRCWLAAAIVVCSEYRECWLWHTRCCCIGGSVSRRYQGYAKSCSINHSELSGEIWQLLHVSWINPQCACTKDYSAIQICDWTSEPIHFMHAQGYPLAWHHECIDVWHPALWGARPC